VKFKLDSTESGDEPMATFREHGNELPATIKNSGNPFCNIRLG